MRNNLRNWKSVLIILKEGSMKSKTVLLIFLFSLTFVCVGVAGVIQLPQTGQTKCYDSAGLEIPCAGTGQDGEIQAGVAWPSPRFVANVGGTITDMLTGLMWPSDAGTPTVGTCTGGAMTWEQAFAYIACLNSMNYLGHNDWRLPNINELDSLSNAGATGQTNYSLDGAAWLTSQGFSNVIVPGDVVTGPHRRLYISSTTFAAAPYLRWSSSIGLNTLWALYNTDYDILPVRAGQSGNPDNTFPANIWKTGQTTSYFAGDDGQMQRGVSWPVPRFGDNGDGTITDNLTGLTWLQDANCMATNYKGFDQDASLDFFGNPIASELGDGAVTWQHALDFIAGINTGTYSKCGAGQTGWRLPNVKEIRSLIDYSNYNPALPTGHPFINVQIGPDFYTWYAHSTSVPDYGLCSWAFYLTTGYLDEVTCGKNNPFFHVWPVRATPPDQCIGTVDDKTSPTITGASVSPSMLWPPNHEMVDVTLDYNAADNCGQPVCQISSVTSNEPISSSDYTIVDAHHVKLRADRLGSGHGRIYTITISCMDASGNSARQAVTVSVPHDQGEK